MNTIRVKCRTNLDAYKHEKWPTELCCMPFVGHYVQSESGASLKIVAITHCYIPYLSSEKPISSLIIELHH